MAYSLIAHTMKDTGDGYQTDTNPIDTTGADLLVVCTSSYDGGDDPVVSDSKGNTWTGLTSHAQSGECRSKIWYCRPTSVGSGHTVTVVGAVASAPYAAVWFMALSGSVASPFDQQNGGNATASTSLSTGSITPSEDNELIIALLSGDGTATGISWSNGFTALESTNGNINQAVGGAAAYKIQTTAAAVSTTPSWTNSGSAATSIASFKAAAGGGGGGGGISIAWTRA